METNDKIQKTTYKDEVVVTNYLTTSYFSFYIERLKSDLNYFFLIKARIFYVFGFDIFDLHMDEIYYYGCVEKDREKHMLKKIIFLLKKLRKIKSVEFVEIRKDRKLWVKLKKSYSSSRSDKVDEENLIANTILDHYDSWKKTNVGTRAVSG